MCDYGHCETNSGLCSLHLGAGLDQAEVGRVVHHDSYVDYYIEAVESAEEALDRVSGTSRKTFGAIQIIRCVVILSR
jgi:hypothetical protein